MDPLRVQWNVCILIWQIAPLRFLRRYSCNDFPFIFLCETLNTQYESALVPRSRCLLCIIKLSCLFLTFSGAVVLLKIMSYFLYFLIISPGKGTWTFLWINLNSPYPRLLFGNFTWNWLSGCEEKIENVKIYSDCNNEEGHLWLENFIWTFGSDELITQISK